MLPAKYYGIIMNRPMENGQINDRMEAKNARGTFKCQQTLDVYLRDLNCRQPNFWQDTNDTLDVECSHL